MPIPAGNRPPGMAVAWINRGIVVGRNSKAYCAAHPNQFAARNAPTDRHRNKSVRRSMRSRSTGSDSIDCCTASLNCRQRTVDHRVVTVEPGDIVLYHQAGDFRA